MSYSYTAVSNGTPDYVCEVLHLCRTGEYLGLLQAKVASISLPDWYVVVTDSIQFQNPSILRALSAESLVLSCYFEDESMFSKLSWWKAEERQWSVIHDSSWSTELKSVGTVPAEIGRFADEAIDRQASLERACFEVPIVAMDYYTGLRHNRNNLDGKC